MRQTRSAGRNRNGGGRAAQQPQVKERRQHEEQLAALDSPLCMKHRGKPVMSAERFLLIVSQLQAKADELWEQEQQELQRGAELMVISCAPASPRSPPPQPSLTPKATGSPSSPPAAFHHPHPHADAGPFEHAAGLLHGASGLASPSLLPLGGHFNSPTWSPGLDALAQQLGLGPMPSSTSVDPADEPIAGINASNLHHGHHHHQHHQHQQQPGHQGHGGPAQHHLQHQQPHHGGQGQLSGGVQAGEAAGAGAAGGAMAGLAHGHPLFTSGLGLYADAEALVTLYPAAGGERAAKARLLEKFEASGTATARQAAAGHDPFASLLSGTPRAEDFLGSPSWTPSAAYL
ncbi:hypothetical protein HYH02_008626 [Chlamydomonas schloesseri]|uniref:Uncharacterized protein n=1 Tax=Chlamydomonas schloesseri TaxID=2026947 RepID=A0A835WD21_9CHLO|nr:hypothetical protein HYH02_008626 [Chlamydomonas schloesseri]|eukprot:KAG2445158.1 hypothetical protein HYH02_008626 [Chlamydomonas schloesseri]